MKEGTAPPRPALTLRIGVTGHRPNRFDAAGQAAARRALDRVFAGMRAAMAALQQREAQFFDRVPPQIRVVSALAEGADRVVAEAGLAAGFALDVILPFPAGLYEGDFAGEDSKRAFRRLLERAHACFTLPGAKSAADPAEAVRAYEAVGLMTLRQCDLVIAVWDGKEASGRGGTQDIVQCAVETGRPVLRFDEHGNGPHLLYGSSVTPSDARDLAARMAAAPAAGEEAIAAMIDHLCAPPGSPRPGEAPHVAEREARAQLVRFLNERERRFTPFAPWYALLLSLFSSKQGFWRWFRQPPYIVGTEAGWQSYWAGLAGMGDAVRDSLRRIVMTRFAWADGLANHYAQQHRSGYISNYVLAALAVLLATIDRWWAPWCEFGAIAVIAATTLHGALGHWHQCWLDDRQLSAGLRHLRILALTGSNTLEARTPHASEEAGPGAQWVGWYCRATAREIGVLPLVADARYVATVRQVIREVEIGEQQRYHRANARQMLSVNHWLDGLSIAAFAVTGLVCLYEAVHAADPVGQRPWWFLPVVLPAFGAALFGIRVHGDFKGSARRSGDMGRRLGSIADKLGSDEPMSFAELSSLTEYAALVMAGEIGDWSFVYRARPLALPT